MKEWTGDLMSKNVCKKNYHIKFLITSYKEDGK